MPPSPQATPLARSRHREVAAVVRMRARAHPSTAKPLSQRARPPYRGRRVLAPGAVPICARPRRWVGTARANGGRRPRRREEGARAAHARRLRERVAGSVAPAASGPERARVSHHHRHLQEQHTEVASAAGVTEARQHEARLEVRCKLTEPFRVSLLIWNRLWHRTRQERVVFFACFEAAFPPETESR